MLWSSRRLRILRGFLRSERHYPVRESRGTRAF